MALMAVCVRSLLDIAQVNVTQSGSFSYFPRPLQRFYGGDDMIVELIIRVKLADMPGDIVIYPGQEFGNLPQFFIRIILARNNQGGHLQPDAKLVLSLIHISEPTRLG